MSGPFLQGPRVVLREVRVEDVGDDYYAWMNDHEVTQYLESRFYPYSRRRLVAYVEKASEDPSSVFLAITRRENGRMIGTIKLGAIDRTHRSAEVALMVGDKGSWGQGYATESIRLVNDYAFRTLNLHKLTAGAYATNEGSIRAFKKAGFQEEARRREQFWSEGQYVDQVWLGLVNANG